MNARPTLSVEARYLNEMTTTYAALQNVAKFVGTKANRAELKAFTEQAATSSAKNLTKLQPWIAKLGQTGTPLVVGRMATESQMAERETT